MRYAVTFILILMELLPYFAVITAVPFAFAVTLPFELTDATELLELEKLAAAPDPESRIPSSCNVEPFLSVI